MRDLTTMSTYLTLMCHEFKKWLLIDVVFTYVVGCANDLIRKRHFRPATRDVLYLTHLTHIDKVHLFKFTNLYTPDSVKHKHVYYHISYHGISISMDWVRKYGSSIHFISHL
jgi:hypothetical protein